MLPFLLLVGLISKITAETWPLPQEIIKKSEYITLSPDFHFITSSESLILSKALTRYNDLITRKSTHGDLISCSIVINNDETSIPLEFDVNEAYIIEVTSLNQCLIKSDTVWGALRGLETFSQELERLNDKSTIIHLTSIKDKPKYPHRGFMVDTSRHYLSLYMLKKSIDAMVMSKLNIFHIHLVDAESFPFESPSSPLLVNGAYTSTSIYTKNDLLLLKEYAEERGILIIHEIDSPGHSASLVHSYPEIMSKCFSKYYYNYNDFALDPTIDKTYDIIGGALNDAADTQPFRLHLGGDEVVYGCWEQDSELNKRMIDMNIDNYDSLLGYYVSKIQNNVLKKSSNIKETTWWQDVFDAMIAAKGNEYDLNTNTTIFQVWRTGGTDIQSITDAGYKVIASPEGYWYLDRGYKWDQIYYFDPKENLTDTQRSKLIGGEAVMFGEQVDNNNFMPKTMPLSATVAERLWTDRDALETDLYDGGPIDHCIKDCTDKDYTQSRLKDFRCRMMSRGFNAAPIWSSGPCSSEFI